MEYMYQQFSEKFDKIEGMIMIHFFYISFIYFILFIKKTYILRHTL